MLWSGKGSMVSKWGYSCLAMLVFCLVLRGGVMDISQCRNDWFLSDVPWQSISSSLWWCLLAVGVWDTYISLFRREFQAWNTVEYLFRTYGVGREGSLLLVCSVFRILERCWMVWLSLLITTTFLDPCNSASPITITFRNNLLKSAVLFHFVVRGWWCACVRACVCVCVCVSLLRNTESSRSGCFIPVERTSDTHLMGSCVDPRAGFDTSEMKKSLVPVWILFQSVADSLYGRSSPGNVPATFLLLQLLYLVNIRN